MRDGDDEEEETPHKSKLSSKIIPSIIHGEKPRWNFSFLLLFN